MKLYRIDATLKFKSCYHSGYEFEVYAKNKTDAIKKARKDVGNLGHTRQDGPLIYSANEVED